MGMRHLLQRLHRRTGFKPGSCDVSTIAGGKPFVARPNFYYFEGCGRPCYLPLNPAPKRGNKMWAVTDGWPMEPLYRPGRRYGTMCNLEISINSGNSVRVKGQVRGQMTVNEIGMKSDIWDVIAVPSNKVSRNAHLIAETTANGDYIVYASDMWLGNTGWHDIPYDMPQATLDLLAL